MNSGERSLQTMPDGEVVKLIDSIASEILEASKKGGVLFHCAAGHDRTGGSEVTSRSVGSPAMPIPILVVVATAIVSVVSAVLVAVIAIDGDELDDDWPAWASDHDD